MHRLAAQHPSVSRSWALSERLPIPGLLREINLAAVQQNFAPHRGHYLTNAVFGFWADRAAYRMYYGTVGTYGTYCTYGTYVP